MAVILTFSAERRRRSRPTRRGEARGEIVIFCGVRIDRSAERTPSPPVPPKLQQPQPGRGFRGGLSEPV